MISSQSRRASWAARTHMLGLEISVVLDPITVEFSRWAHEQRTGEIAGSTPTSDRPIPATVSDPSLVVGRLLRIHPALVARLRAALAAEGYTDFDVVRLLLLFDERVHHRRSNQVAKELGVTRARATRIVERAEADGLVSRRRTTLDGRAVSVGLTALGTTRLHELRPTLREFAEVLWGSAATEALPALERMERRVTLRPRPWFGARSSRFRRLSDWDEG